MNTKEAPQPPKGGVNSLNLSAPLGDAVRRGLKPSGIEWLGDIPEHWEVKKVGQLFRLRIEKSGIDHGKELLSVYSSIGVKPRKDMEQRGNKASTTNDYWIVKKGDIVSNKLLAWMGAIGVSHYEGVTSPAYDILMPICELNSDYFHYLFRTKLYIQQFKIRSRGILDMKLRFYFDEFKTLSIATPPIEEQNQIAQYLDYKTKQINRFIKNKQKLIKLLKEQKQNIINQAVTGKKPLGLRRSPDRDAQNDKAPSQGVGGYKPSGIEWLGDIPEHWEVKKVRQIFECLNNRRIPLSSVERGKMANRKYDYYGASSVIDKVENFIFDDKLILIAEDGANLVFRNLPLVIIAKGQFWVNNHAHILKPKEDNLEYLAYALERIDYLPWISGAAQPKLTKNRLLSVNLPLPPLEEQKTIVEYIEKETAIIDKVIERTEKEIELIKEYKTTLISEVVTGKLPPSPLKGELSSLSSPFRELEGFNDEIEPEENLDEELVELEEEETN